MQLVRHWAIQWNKFSFTEEDKRITKPINFFFIASEFVIIFVQASAISFIWKTFQTNTSVVSSFICRYTVACKDLDWIMTLSNPLDGDSELLPRGTAWPTEGMTESETLLEWSSTRIALMQISNNLFPFCSVKQQQLLISLVSRQAFRAVQCISSVSRADPSAGVQLCALCPPCWVQLWLWSPGCEQRAAPAAAALCCQPGNCSRTTLARVSPLTEEHDTRFLLKTILRSNKNPLLEENSLCPLALPPTSLCPSLLPVLLGVHRQGYSTAALTCLLGLGRGKADHHSSCNENKNKRVLKLSPGVLSINNIFLIKSDGPGRWISLCQMGQTSTFTEGFVPRILQAMNAEEDKAQDKYCWIYISLQQHAWQL